MIDEPRDEDDVRRRLAEIQSRKRGGIRWNVSKHTAELAIVAIETPEVRPRQARPSGKSRRRKRNKRLL